MAGLLNATQGKQPQGEKMQGADTPDSSILAKIQSGVEGKVQGEIRKHYLALTVAGMKIMFSESTGQRIMQKLKSSENIVSDVSQGVANIIATIFNEVGSKMSPEQQGQLMAAAMPASIVLMCQALDAWQKITGQEVTNELAAECASATSKAMLTKFKITPDQIRDAVAQGQQQGAVQPPAGV